LGDPEQMIIEQIGWFSSKHWIWWQLYTLWDRTSIWFL